MGFIIYDLDVSVGHMLYFLCAVVHMLCVVMLHLIWIGVHCILCFQPKCAFGYMSQFALCLDVLVVRLLFFSAVNTSLAVCFTLCPSTDMLMPDKLHICTQYTVVCVRYVCTLPTASCLWTVSVRGTLSAHCCVSTLYINVFMSDVLCSVFLAYTRLLSVCCITLCHTVGRSGEWIMLHNWHRGMITWQVETARVVGM